MRISGRGAGWTGQKMHSSDADTGSRASMSGIAEDAGKADGYSFQKCHWRRAGNDEPGSQKDCTQY